MPDELTILASPPVKPRAEVPWQRAMKTAVRDGRQLCQLLGLGAAWESQAERAAASFPVFAPLGYIARMRYGDPRDPLLRQVLPLADENVDVPGFTADPVGDRTASLGPGLLQKYEGRVLLITTGACAVHCRYCFRRHYPYADGPHSPSAWEPALAQIAEDDSIHEVILSGGDPLTIVDEQLSQLVARIVQIPHVERLRVHTRLPVIIPERVTQSMLGWLRGTRLSPIVIVHANHAAELDDAVARSLAKLVDAGVVVLNQAVLLRGVNDTADAQYELCQRLVNLRVMPYYLHQLDRVAGAAHFEVPEPAGHAIIAELCRRLPGYAVPRYVREVEGGTSKVALR